MQQNNGPTHFRPYISPSRLGMWERCQEQYRRRYIEGEIVLPGIALLTGSGVHKGAEVNFTQKIESYRDLPASDIVEASVVGFEERYRSDGLLLSGLERKTGERKVIATAKDQVAALADLHAKSQAPLYQPAHVEKEVRFPIPNEDYDIFTIVDLIDDQDRVIDFKTAARSKPAHEADMSLQLTAEAMAFRAIYKRWPKSVSLEVLLKTKKPGRQILESKRTKRDADVFLQRVGVLLCGVKSGVFSPAASDHWCCSERFCGYARTCPFYVRRGKK